jgi:putative flippase GtrA
MVAGRELAVATRARLARFKPPVDGLIRGTESAKAFILAKLPDRFHAITDELAKFGIIGVINLIVNFAVFNLLLYTLLPTGEVKAKAVATIVATTCAYFLNRHWTYRDRPKSTLRREYTLFFLFNVVGLVIEVTVVGIAKYGFHQTHLIVLNLCTAVGIGLGTIFRFWAYRTHVFKEAVGEDFEDSPAVQAVAAFATVEPLREDEPTGGEPVATAGVVTAEVVTADVSDVADSDGPAADDDGADDADDADAATDPEDQKLRGELVQLELHEMVNRAGQPIRR